MKDSGPKIRLLMVDDEEEFLEATAPALGRRGIEVTTATRGEEALRLAKESEFDAVLLDVKMPGMDGVEVFRRLQVQQPGLPTIILTGHASLSQAFQTTKEGLLDYIAKPCDIEDLADKIRNAAASRRVPSLLVPEGGTIIRVLLVDDEVELLETLESVLGRRGMKVLTASDGVKGLEVLATELIDVVVLDVKMPGLDGLEVLKRIKRDEPLVEVILLTGHPTVDTALEGMKLGASEYVVKPTDVDDLVEKIRTAFAKRDEAILEAQQEAIRKILDRYPPD